MDNYTYYKEEIKDILIDGGSLAVDIQSGKPADCRNISCAKCLFDDMGDDDYDKVRRSWLNAEHVERPTLTKDEYTLLSLLKPDCYIARDNNGHIWIYTNGNIRKTDNYWIWDNGVVGYSQQIMYSEFSRLSNILSFVKWEDEKPWKVEDLLKLEVK